MAAPQLFDVNAVGRVRSTDPDTSRAAARRIGSALPSLRSRILVELGHADLTDRELCRIIVPDLPLRWQSVISARAGLKKDGLVRETPVRREGRTVWALEEEGVQTITLKGGQL